MVNRTLGGTLCISSWLMLASCTGIDSSSIEAERVAQAATSRFVASKIEAIDRTLARIDLGTCNPRIDKTCGTSDPKPCDPTTDKTCTEPKPCDPTTDKTCTEPKPCDPTTDKTCTEPKPCDPKADKTCTEPKPCDPKTDRTCTGEPKPCDPAADKTCSEPKPCDPKTDRSCGDPSQDTSDGCDRNRLIGSASGGCPLPTGEWKGGPMFGKAKVTSLGGGQICSYDYMGDPAKYSLRGLPYDDKRPPEQWLDHDCPVVVALEGELAQKALASVGPSYVKGYRQQMAAAPLPAFGSLPAKVQVAVLDSAPDGDFDPQAPGPDHGRVVGASIKDLTCPAGDSQACAIQLSAAQVLNQDTSPDMKSSYGYIGDLARQLVKVVDLNPGVPLVVNLSVGYHPKYSLVDTADDVDMWHEATDALMAAVNYATCSGALVIAAAGNRDDGPMLDFDDSRPMFPASLGEHTTWNCPSMPLLHAASGVMPNDSELPNARPGSTAGLVAPAFAVGVDMGPDTANALPLKTGSSFAASGVSATAAIVWSYLPLLGAQEVISIVRATGVTLPDLGEPDFCASSDCGVVKRVSVCNAASAAIAVACNNPAVAPDCNGILPLACQTPAAGTGKAVRADDSVFEQLAEHIDASYQSINNTSCSMDPVWATAPDLGQEMLCADESYSNAQSRPFSLSPLPGADPCQICLIFRYLNYYTLYAAYQPSYAAGSLSATTLRTASDAPQALGNKLSGAYGANLVAVPLMPLNGSSAALSHQVTGQQTSITSTVPIIDLSQ